MKFKQITIVLLGLLGLLGLFLSTILVSCNTGSTVDHSYDKNYEVLKNWTLSNELSELSINDYIHFDGGHSIQIINAGCGDLTLKNAITLDIESDESEDIPEQTFEVSVTVRRSPTDYDENDTVDHVEDPAEGEDPILRGENFSVVIYHQGGTDYFLSNTLLSEEAEIELDLTWETKTFTFVTESDAPVTLVFRLGCDLEMFWIDDIEITNITPEIILDET